MDKRFLGQAKSWVGGGLLSGLLSGLLVLSIWFVPVQPAQAGKTPRALLYDKTGNSVEVVAIYETAYPTQKSVYKSLKRPTKLMKKASGFQGASMLRSQNGKQVITFAQWQDLASYKAYQASPPSSDSDDEASAPPEPAQTLLFDVAAFKASVEGATPALRGKEAVVQLVQFTPKNDRARSQVLTYAEEMLPRLVAQQPIPQSVLLLQGVNYKGIALLVNWNCKALFEDVGQPQAIDIPPNLSALAKPTQQFYNVANIIPAQSQNSGDENEYEYY